MSSKFAALEAQLLDATQGGDLLRVRTRPPRRAAHLATQHRRAHIAPAAQPRRARLLPLGCMAFTSLRVVLCRRCTGCC